MQFYNKEMLHGPGAVTDGELLLFFSHKQPGVLQLSKDDSFRCLSS